MIDARNVSSVVAKDGGNQENNQSCEIHTVAAAENESDCCTDTYLRGHPTHIAAVAAAAAAAQSVTVLGPLTLREGLLSPTHTNSNDVKKQTPYIPGTYVLGRLLRIWLG